MEFLGVFMGFDGIHLAYSIIRIVFLARTRRSTGWDAAKILLVAEESMVGVNFRYVLCLEQFISIFTLAQYLFQISNHISVKVNCR